MLTAIIEALLFASGNGIHRNEIYEGLKDKFSKKEIENTIEELKGKYCGDSGIHIIEYNGKLQMQTNPEFGELLADLLQETRERELSKTLLQVLAIVVYKQPITRTEIEEVRGSNPDYVLGMLLKLNLIEPKGRKDTIGHPILYGTTDEFLRKFGISDVSELPEYDDIMLRIKNNYDKYHEKSSGLYRDRTIGDEDSTTESEELVKKAFEEQFNPNSEESGDDAERVDDEEVASTIDETPENSDVVDDKKYGEDSIDDDDDDDELPEFLAGEDVIEVE